MEESREPICPCCDKPLPLGLFSHVHLAPLPVAIRIMLAGGEDEEAIDVGETVIRACGRSFLLCEAPLPLSWRQSPVRVRTWVECDARTADRLANSPGSSGLDSFVGEGVLASDLSFFSGSVGSAVAIGAGEGLPIIHRVGDDRVQALPNRPSHDELVAIYRRGWGNADPVAEADPEFRYALNAALQEELGRPCYRQPVEPPAPLAGITPAELLVSPPFDVGEEAVMATIGCAEVFGKQPPTELIGLVRNPSPDFVKSFSEFCYLSRLNRNLIGHGLIVPEYTKIPDTSRMTSWLLVNPSSVRHSIFQNDSLVVKGREVQILTAIPLYPEEQSFGQQEGVEALLDNLAAEDIDLTDLHRINSCK